MSIAPFDDHLAARILDARTRALARRDSQHDDTAPTRRVLAFALGSDTYGLAIEDSAGVLPFDGYTPMPNAKPGIIGIIGARGQIHTVLDAAALLNAAAVEGEATGHLILLRAPRPRLALRCARVLGVVNVVMADAGDAPADLSGSAVRYGRVPKDSIDLAETSIAVVDLGALLAPFRPEKQEPST